MEVGVGGGGVVSQSLAQGSWSHFKEEWVERISATPKPPLPPPPAFGSPPAWRTVVEEKGRDSWSRRPFCKAAQRG